MSYLDKFEAFSITKYGDKYKLNPFDSKSINQNNENKKNN